MRAIQEGIATEMLLSLARRLRIVPAMNLKFRPLVTVIGGGLGGLASAIRLAAAGCQVTVLERNAHLGGKMGTLEWEGFHWDTGPSLLTMPHVLSDLWESVGGKLEEDLTLIPLGETCRYRWEDGTVIQENEAFWKSPEVAAFLAHAKGLYDISADSFLHHPLPEWKRQLTWRNLPLLRHLPKLADPRPMATTTARFFPDSPHLQQLFNRFATYNGSSPYKAPSAFHIIPYVQARFGGWYVQGGMGAIAAAMVKLARRHGVQFETGEEVTRLQDNAGRWTVFHRAAAGGPVRPRHCDGIVCNMDTLAATKRFLDPAFEPKSPLSMSGFVIQAAIGRTYPDLAHHNILFSRDYPNEFREIFSEASPATDPTIYISISAKSEAGRAPDGCENWFVLVNAPPARPEFDWSHFAQRYADRIFSMFPRFGLDDPRPHIRWMHTFTPENFASTHLAMGGALYGYASHSATSAFKRPAMISGARGLVFAGGSTHPGGGIPLVVLSGQMAAGELLRQLGRNPLVLSDARRD